MLGYQDIMYVLYGNHFFFVLYLIKGTIDFIFGELGQEVLKDYDIQVRIPPRGHENIIIAQGRNVKNDSGAIVI